MYLSYYVSIIYFYENLKDLCVFVKFFLSVNQLKVTNIFYIYITNHRNLKFTHIIVHSGELACTMLYSSITKDTLCQRYSSITKDTLCQRYSSITKDTLCQRYLMPKRVKNLQKGTILYPLAGLKKLLSKYLQYYWQTLPIEKRVSLKNA